MKGFIAVALALVPEFLALKLAKPLHLVLSFDEELGCLGGPRLIRRYLQDFPKAHAAIIGEPTGMRLANAHKGVSVFRTRITGKPGHSSNPGAGVNAIAVAADAIRFLMTEAEALTRGHVDQRFVPPHATVCVGQIEGGTAINIIAGECSFVWDCRSVAGTEAAALEAAFQDHCALELLPPMREVAPEAQIRTTRQASVPPLVAKDDNAAEMLVRRVTGQNQAQVSSFASEAGMFQQAGIPAVLCGPGEIAQAHQPDEFVAVSQLAACGDFLRALGRWCAGA